MKKTRSPRDRARNATMIRRTVTTLVLIVLAACVSAAPHRVSASQAAKIAQAKYHGKLLGTPKLEHEDGVWQYEVLLRVGKTMKEVDVNADSEKIGNVENTTAKEEVRESKAQKKGKGKEKGE